MQLTFFTTSQCHLCELAENLLVHTPMPQPIPVEAVDIASSPELVDRYGTRIPVLRREDTGAELDFPFDLNRLLDWLQDVLAEEGWAGPSAGMTCWTSWARNPSHQATFTEVILTC